MSRWRPPMWMDQAACLDPDVDPELFFPPKGGMNDYRTNHLSIRWPAMAICEQCPVRAECLMYAYKTDQRHGIWGGLTPNSRTLLMTKHRSQKDAGVT